MRLRCYIGTANWGWAHTTASKSNTHLSSWFDNSWPSSVKNTRAAVPQLLLVSRRIAYTFTAYIDWWIWPTLLTWGSDSTAGRCGLVRFAEMWLCFPACSAEGSPLFGTRLELWVWPLRETGTQRAGHFCASLKSFQVMKHVLLCHRNLQSYELIINEWHKTTRDNSRRALWPTCWINIPSLDPPQCLMICKVEATNWAE